MFLARRHSCRQLYAFKSLLGGILQVRCTIVRWRSLNRMPPIYEVLMTTILRKNATCQIPTCNAVLCQHHLRSFAVPVLQEVLPGVCSVDCHFALPLLPPSSLFLCELPQTRRLLDLAYRWLSASWCRHVCPNVGPLRSNVECRRVFAFRPRHLSYTAQFSLYSCQLPQVRCPCKVRSF